MKYKVIFEADEENVSAKVTLIEINEDNTIITADEASNDEMARVCIENIRRSLYEFKDALLLEQAKELNNNEM